MLERRAKFAICLMSLGLSGCLSNHCEVYPEHCVEDGISEGSSGTGTETADDTGTDTTDDTDGGAPGLYGDGLIGGDQECDDGNDLRNDNCTTCCTATLCGNAIVESEVAKCDAGQANGLGNAYLY